MTAQEWNIALYQKMFAEQEKYREWLLSQPPEEILRHAYEYVAREDILLSLEYNDLTGRQAKALEKSPSPLNDVFQSLEKREGSHMEEVWQALESTAHEAARKEFLKQVGRGR